MFKSTSKSSDDTLKVRTALCTTRQNHSDFFYAMLQNRISVYPQFKTIHDLETELQKSSWEEVTDKAKESGFTVFTAPIPGNMKYVRVQDLPNDTIFSANESNETESLFLTVSGIEGTLAPLTYLFIGMQKGDSIVINFHPGQSICPSEIYAPNILPGTKLRKIDAMRMGLTWAKIID